MTLNESIVENAALTWFGKLGYAIGHGPKMAPSEAAESACAMHADKRATIKRCLQVRFERSIP